MPFLIIICVGVIIVLVFNLWKAVFSAEPSGDAFMHIESGSVQMRMWNTDDYFDLKSDTLVMEGDEILTSADSKVIIEFFDGTIMRIDGGTNVLFKEIDDDNDNPMIDLLFLEGKLWFNKLYKDTGDTEIVVTMDNVAVKSTVGSIFEVENEFEEAVRVLKVGEVVVDIMSEDNTKVIETENVGLGQEILFTDKVLEKYWQYQSPSVLSPLSDEFKDTDWYLWNDAEDKSPTEFSKAEIMGTEEELIEVAPEVLVPEEEDTLESEGDAEIEVEAEGSVDESEEEDIGSREASNVEEEFVPEESVGEETVEEESEQEADLGTLTKPTINSVAGVTEVDENGYYVVSSKVATLSGNISGAQEVVVSGYTLQKFNPGDSTWTYYANADYDLMEPGENVYEVHGVAPDGSVSDSLYVKVWYAPPGYVEESSEEQQDSDDGS
ncbi:hypothetical protein GF366_01110 [Candidatus Peregrinibacteria bacterium]|nr:hypothetical protein [Candidatus Peregrinibacteria bacterium]